MIGTWRSLVPKPQLQDIHSMATLWQQRLQKLVFGMIVIHTEDNCGANCKRPLMMWKEKLHDDVLSL